MPLSTFEYFLFLQICLVKRHSNQIQIISQSLVKLYYGMSNHGRRFSFLKRPFMNTTC